ncbi:MULTISPECIES: STAS domain-containing protein [unclassified Aureimonas]|uniref:STAS domain-containing protein n=1 Tax=unclassified Aureimonas TaxID=2615206 RepID=UPI000A8B4498|nr:MULTISPECIES: STAS domain-containing protein [unclassified Aureimonas]
MASKTSSSLGAILLAQRAEIVAAWQANTAALLARHAASPQIAGLLRAEAAEFLSELCRYVGDEEAGAGETSRSFARLTALAAGASAAHAREGLTPSETSSFVLSFRDALTPFVVEAFAADGRRLTAELARIGAIVDRLAIDAAEAHGATRETMIERQSRAIVDLSTPVLQVWPQILLMPLVGVVDTRRAQQVMEDLLNAIARDRALVVILDVTGVPVIDTRVALHLTKTVSAANMLGAQVILTGISPDAAQTLVKLDVDLKAIRTRGTLHFGLVEALRMLGQKVGDHAVRSGGT